MFEKILEAVLQKYAGKFLDGIDSNNLSIGVFSGDVVIENVQIKQEILNMLELPIQLKFSHIGKLQLKVPMTSIGSSPVEVFLDGLYMVIAPKHPNQWEFKDYKGLEVKKELIEQYVQSCISKILSASKQKTEGKDAGYMQNLQLKIIDNIQLTIKSIHIRYENNLTGPDQQQYSMGISLDQLDVYTTDGHGNKKYIDRTKEEFKDQPMRKQLILSNLGVYWNSRENRILSSENNKKDIIQHMEGMIRRQNQTITRIPCDYLISISSIAKLIQSEKGNFSRPEVEMNIDLNRIDFSLENQQLQQIILLAEFFNQYNMRLQHEKKTKKLLNSEQIQVYQNQFQELYTKILEDKNQSYSVLTLKQKNQIEECILSLEIDTMLEITKNICLQVEKQKKLKELIDQKQKEQQGFFGGWFGGGSNNKGEDLITEEDKKQLDSFFDENFSSQLDYSNILRPQDYVWFILEFNLQGGSIYLNKVLFEREKEGIEFTYENLGGSVKMRGEKNKQVQLSIATMKLEMVNDLIQNQGQQDQDHKKIVNFLRPNEYMIQDKNFVQFMFEAYPLEESHIDKSVQLKIGSARVEYNPVFVNRIVKFFDVKLKDEELKQATWEKVEEQLESQINNLNQAIVSPSILKLDIYLRTPVILLPYKNDGSLNNECWVINLGNLSVKTNQDVLKPNLSIQEQAVDIYDINLENIKFEVIKFILKQKYFPSLFYFNQTSDKIMRSENPPIWTNKLLPDQFILVQNFSIYVSVTIIKGQFQSQYLDKPNIFVQGKLDSISLNLTRSMYKRILSIGQCFALQENDTKNQTVNVEDLQLERIQLMKNANKVGQIYIRGQQIKTWQKKYGILSKGYLYIFQNVKDVKAETYYWVKNSQINSVSEELTGLKNSFNVMNKYTDIYLACEKEENSQQWIQILREQVTNEQKIVVVKTETESPTKQKKPDDPNKKQMQLIFLINNINLSLFEEDCVTKFLQFESRSLALDYENNIYGFDCKLSLGGIYLTDYLYKHKDPALRDFISSQGTENINELISIQIKQRQKTHPQYKNIDMDIEVFFGVLVLNFKPNSLIKVLQFVKVDKPPANDSKNESDKILQSNINQSTIDALEQGENNVKPALYTSQNDTILLKAKVFIQQIKLVFVNRNPPYLTIAEISIQETGVTFQQKIDEMLLDGKLGNFQLFDLTNYPNTIHNEEDWEKCKRTEMIGVLKEKGTSLLEIKFRMLQDGSPKIQADNVAMFVHIKISKIVASFMMQPTMRLIDYSLTQLIGPITNPEQLQTQQKSEQLDPIDQLRLLGINAVLKNIINPKGMLIDILLEDPTVILKPNPDSYEYLSVDLGKIIIKNQRMNNNSRILDNKRTDISKTFSDAYQIYLSNMEIKLIKGLKEIQMCKPFNFNLEVEMPLFVNEYQFVFGNDLVFNKIMKIKCYVSPLVILMTNEDYNFIMRVLFHNITYDDGCDRFMIDEYEKRQQPLNKSQGELNDSKIKDQAAPAQGGGIHFNLDMENVSFFAGEGEESIPFARVTLDKMRIQFIKESLDSYVKIFCEELDGSYFTKQIDNNVYLEKGLLRKFDVNNQYNEDQMKDSFFLIHSIKQKDLNDMAKAFQFTDFDEKSQTLQFILDMVMKISGDKDINIKVSHFTVLAETGPLLKLAGLAIMNETVTPPQPIYKAPLKDQQQIQKDNLAQKQQEAGNNMIINIRISNIVICTPAAETLNILAIKGEFLIQINFYRVLNVKEVVQQMEIDNMTFEQAYELNMKSQFSIILQQLEIFITNEFELQHQKEFKFMKKRELLYPLDVNLKIKQYMVINKELDNFYLKQEIKLSIQQAIIKVSAQNLLLIQQTVNYMLEQMPQKNLPKKEKLPEIRLQDDEGMQSEVIELQELCQDPTKQYQSIIDVNGEGFQIMIINDIGKIFTPVLDFNLEEFQLKIVNNPINSKITTTLTFNSQYFNSRASDWEPVIEQVRFHIDIINNQVGNVQSLICLKLESISDLDTEKLNINISTQFISALMQMIYLMQEQIQKTFKKSKTKSYQKQAVQSNTDLKVSPYTIKNETGYPIIVKGNGNQQIQIESNSQINYEVEKNRESIMRRANIQEVRDQIRFSICCKSYNLQDIENVDLERMRCKKIFVQGGNYISSQVKLDIKTNGKILNISSSLLFCNKTMKRLAFEFVSPKMKFDKIVAKQNKNVPVPFECSQAGTLTLYFEEEEEQKIELNQFQPSNKKKTTGQPSKVVIQLKNIQQTAFQEIAVGDQFLLLRLAQDPSNEFKKIIYIEPPYRFKNCLPKCMHIQLLLDNKRTDKTQELSQKQIYEYYDCSQTRKMYIKILLPGYFWSDDMILFDPEKKVQRIKIKDSVKNRVFIPYYQYLTGDKNGCREYFFYCKAYIINDSPYDLVYYSQHSEKKSEPKIIGGQQEIEPDQDITQSITIMGEEVNSSLIFADKNSPDNLSLGISTTGVGTNQVDISINNQLLTFGVQVQLQQTEKQHGLLTQIIKVSPRFILVNLSDRDIVIKQASVESPKMINKLLLRKNERKPLFWFDKEKEKKICINYFEVDEQNNNEEDLCPDDHSLWSWSFPIDVSNIGVQNFLIRSKANLKNYKFFRTDTRSGEANIFVVFENLPEDQIPYKIFNNIGGFADLYIPQILCTLKNNDFTHFSWDDPSNQNKLLKITVKSQDYKDITLDINPDIINFTQKIKLQNENKSNDSKYLKFGITIDGFTKIVTFQMSDKKEKIVKRKDQQDVIQDAKNQIEEEKMEVSSRTSSIYGDTIVRQISLHIECIGLSIIENHSDNKWNNRELLFIKLENVELAIQEKKNIKTSQLRIKYINIDNNSNYFVTYPVTLTPQKKEQYKNTEKDKYFLNILVVQNLSAKNITLYDNLVFEIDPMSLKIEWSLINSLINYMSGLFECMDIIQNKEEQELQIFLKYLNDLQNKKFRYLDDQVPDVQAPTYIDQIIISPIQIFLTFKSEKSMTEGSNIMLLDTLFSIIGVTVLNVDNSPLKLNGIKLNNCLDTLPGITNKLITHYKDQALREGLKIVGSLNVIGNPVGLFNNISTGVNDLFDKPIEGFAKGPLEGGMGIMKGATSLVTKTLSGAFNTVSTMTGAVGSGFATLCFDDKYLEEREKMRNKKPKHLVDGVAQGLQSLGKGVFQGISGIFLKPFEGAQKDGIIGFFKGVGQGLTGVVVKPITGIIDVVSKTTEGLKNTATLFDDKPNESRERPIRVFYGPDRCFKNYLTVDGEIVCVLQLLKKGKFAHSYYLTSIPIEDNSNQKAQNILVLLLDSVIFLSGKKQKHKWIIETKNIRNLDNHDEIKIYFKGINKYFDKNAREVGVEFLNPKQREYAFHQLQNLMTQNEQESRFASDQEQEIGNDM